MYVTQFCIISILIVLVIPVISNSEVEWFWLQASDGKCLAGSYFTTCSPDTAWSLYGSKDGDYSLQSLKLHGCLDRKSCHSSTSDVRLYEDCEHCGAIHWAVKSDGRVCEDDCKNCIVRKGDSASIKHCSDGYESLKKVSLGKDLIFMTNINGMCIQGSVFADCCPSTETYSVTSNKRKVDNWSFVTKSDKKKCLDREHCHFSESNVHNYDCSHCGAIHWGIKTDPNTRIAEDSMKNKIYNTGGQSKSGDVRVRRNDPNTLQILPVKSLNNEYNAGQCILDCAVGCSSSTQKRASRLVSELSNSKINIQVSLDLSGDSEYESLTQLIGRTILDPNAVGEDGILNHEYLKVTHIQTNMRAIYTGRHTKRRREIPNITTYTPVSIDLTKNFYFSMVGNYHIELIGPGALHGSIIINVEEPNTLVFPTKIESIQTSYNGCSNNQKTTIDTASTNGITNSNSAKVLLDEYSSKSTRDSRIVEWFNWGTNSDLTTLSGYFKNIKNLLQGTKVNYDCTLNGCKPGVYAFVYPNDNTFTIYLCDQFWNAPANSGYDTQAGTLIHEASHFTSIAGTNDYNYGVVPNQCLANVCPPTARKNADNLEHFSENLVGSKSVEFNPNESRNKDIEKCVPKKEEDKGKDEL